MTQGLKQFSQLWSLQTLADLPDRLRNLWQQLIGSYWFIPTACVVVGILLAPLLVTIDEHFDRKTVRELTFAFTGDDDAARAIMTTIAGAVLGVAGTTFSITIAVLSMASSQFGALASLAYQLGSWYQLEHSNLDSNKAAMPLPNRVQHPLWSGAFARLYLKLSGTHQTLWRHQLQYRHCRQLIFQHNADEALTFDLFWRTLMAVLLVAHRPHYGHDAGNTIS